MGLKSVLRRHRLWPRPIVSFQLDTTGSPVYTVGEQCDAHPGGDASRVQKIYRTMSGYWVVTEERSHFHPNRHINETSVRRG
jgi:hypothetical protein